MLSSPKKGRSWSAHEGLPAQHKLPEFTPRIPFALCKESYSALTSQQMPCVPSLFLLTLVFKNSLFVQLWSSFLSARLNAASWSLPGQLIVENFLLTDLSPGLVDSHVVHTSSPVFLSVCVLNSSSYKDTSHTGLEPARITSFYLNHFFLRPYVQIQSHSEVLGGSRISTYKDPSRCLFMGKEPMWLPSPEWDLQEITRGMFQGKKPTSTGTRERDLNYKLVSPYSGPQRSSGAQEKEEDRCPAPSLALLSSPHPGAAARPPLPQLCVHTCYQQAVSVGHVQGGVTSCTDPATFTSRILTH